MHSKTLDALKREKWQKSFMTFVVNVFIDFISRDVIKGGIGFFRYLDFITPNFGIQRIYIIGILKIHCKKIKMYKLQDCWKWSTIAWKYAYELKVGVKFYKNLTFTWKTNKNLKVINIFYVQVIQARTHMTLKQCTFIYNIQIFI
jgi:hypothetical protein